jgi:hypothetical protein
MIMGRAAVERKLAQDMSKLAMPRMTQMCVPYISDAGGREVVMVMNSMNGGSTERVHVARGVTSKQNHRHERILVGKPKRIKFHRHPIVTW